MVIRVLIVDDSATQRRLLRMALAKDKRLCVIGEAADPYEARAQIKALCPDVLTLDIEMPRMNGLDFLRQIMRLRPMPVVVLSNLTEAGSDAAIEALSLGAADCIAKAPAAFGVGPDGLANRVVAAATIRRHFASPLDGAQVSSQPFRWNGKIVLIGASTGGVEALERVFSAFPANGPPTLVTQHMPQAYLARFAARLDRSFQPKVRLAQNGMAVERGHIYLAPGGDTHLMFDPNTGAALHLRPRDDQGGYCPSVERMFQSAQPIAARVVAVLLTGMGRDGAQAMVGLRRAGADCIVQDEASSAVFGMPGAAIAAGAVASGLPLSEIGNRILTLTGSAQMNPCRYRPEGARGSTGSDCGLSTR